MRKVIATEFYTLDGLMSDPRDEMDWVTADFDKELGTYEDDVYDRADTLLLGRVTYEIFRSYWPHAASSPDTPADEIGMARRIDGIAKIVFSRTLEDAGWKNVTVVDEISPDGILEMKRQPGRDMLLVGSASIVQQFTKLGLIDEYHFAVHPVVLGRGKPLFEGLDDRTRLKLVKSTTFKTGVVLLEYQSDAKHRRAPRL